MECFSKRQLVARDCILIKKKFYKFGTDRFYKKKLSNDNYVYIVLAARPAFGGSLASQWAAPPGPPFDSMPVSWMKSAYYNKVDICLCTNTKILSLVQ